MDEGWNPDPPSMPTVDPERLVPLDGRVLVEVHEAEEATASGLVIPEQSRTRHAGRVVALGPGKWTPEGRVPASVEVGDEVELHPYAGYRFRARDGKVYGLIPSQDVLARR